jgi:hypothetical protein
LPLSQEVKPGTYSPHGASEMPLIKDSKMSF